MIIIGEKLNSTLSAIRPAIENYDKEAISDVATKQHQAGADFIDINAGMFVHEEPERLAWMAEVVQTAVDTPLAIDSPDPKAMRKALEANRNPNILLNSITLEPKRFADVIPLVCEFKTSVIALCMDQDGVPATVADRLRIAEKLVARLTGEGMSMEDIYLDPIVLPVSTGKNSGQVTLETIRQIRQQFPKVHISCGLSNISFGLPARKLLNRSFLAAAMGAGLDAAILDPLDREIMSTVAACQALLGKDDHCKSYLKKIRSGLIVE